MALLEFVCDRGCPVVDRLPITMVALARVSAANGGLLEQAEFARVEHAGEEFVLARVRHLEQPVGESGPQGVGVVGDGRVADDRAAREQPGRALRELVRGSSRKRRASFQPVAEVDATPDDEGVVAAELGDLPEVLDLDVDAALDEARPDAGRDLARSAVFSRCCNRSAMVSGLPSGPITYLTLGRWGSVIGTLTKQARLTGTMENLQAAA